LRTATAVGSGKENCQKVYLKGFLSREIYFTREKVLKNY
jgi:hypothetical protein